MRKLIAFLALITSVIVASAQNFTVTAFGNTEVHDGDVITCGFTEVIKNVIYNFEPQLELHAKDATTITVSASAVPKNGLQVQFCGVTGACSILNGTETRSKRFASGDVEQLQIDIVGVTYANRWALSDPLPCAVSITDGVTTLNFTVNFISMDQAAEMVYTVDGIEYKFRPESYTLEVVGCDAETVDLNIPGYAKVTLIGHSGPEPISVGSFYGGERFAKCKKLKTVTFQYEESVTELTLTPSFPNQNIEQLNIGSKKDCVIYSRYAWTLGEHYYYPLENQFKIKDLRWFPGGHKTLCKRYVVEKFECDDIDDDKGTLVTRLENSQVSPTAFINSNIEELIIPGTLSLSSESFIGCNKLKTLFVGYCTGQLDAFGNLSQPIRAFFMNQYQYDAVKEKFPAWNINGGARLTEVTASAGKLNFVIPQEEGVTVKSISVVPQSSKYSVPEPLALEPNKTGKYSVAISPFVTEGYISVQFTHELSGEQIYVNTARFMQEVAADFSADPVINLIRAENGLVECNLLNTDYVDNIQLTVGDYSSETYNQPMRKQPDGNYIGLIGSIEAPTQYITASYTYKPEVGTSTSKVQYQFDNSHGLPMPSWSIIELGHFKAQLKLDYDLSKFAFADYLMNICGEAEFSKDYSQATIYNSWYATNDIYIYVDTLGSMKYISIAPPKFKEFVPSHLMDELTPFAAVISDNTDYLDIDGFERQHRWTVRNKYSSDNSYYFTTDDTEVNLSNLKHNTSYTVDHSIQIYYKYLPIAIEGTIDSSEIEEYERRWTDTYTEYFEFTTPAVVLTTKPAQAVSNDCAIICAETNLSENEIGTGFEWRRYDAPDLVPSTKVECPIYGGMMSGKLRGLSSNTYYKYRPYFEDPDGETVYGEWTAFGTADAYVYFEPTVYTYKPRMVGTDYAEVMAYALGGSDEITEQGIEYWPEARSRAAEGEVVKLTSTGQRMNFELTDLKPGTKYQVRAFATTAKETTYGEVQPFTTQGVPESGIEEVAETAEPALYTVYTLSGQCVRRNAESLTGLRPGLYIINGRKHIVR